MGEAAQPRKPDSCVPRCRATHPSHTQLFGEHKHPRVFHSHCAQGAVWVSVSVLARPWHRESRMRCRVRNLGCIAANANWPHAWFHVGACARGPQSGIRRTIQHPWPPAGAATLIHVAGEGDEQAPAILA